MPPGIQLDNNSTLSQVLLNQGIISKAQFDEANADSLQAGKTIEDVLLQKQYITNLDLTKAKGIVYGIPFVDIASQDISRDINKGLDEEIASKNKILLFEKDGNNAKAAMSNPLDIQSTRLIEQQLGIRIQVYIAEEKDLLNKISSVVGNSKGGNDVSSYVEEAVTDTDVVDLSDESTSLEGLDLSSAPIAKIVNSILQNAAKSKASDVHIEPLEDVIRIRYRIHGILQEVNKFPVKLLAPLVSRIKILGKMAIDERRIPLDGRFQIKLGDEAIDLRVSSLPTVNGEKIVIRLLRKDSGILSLTDTGLRGSTYKVFTEGLKATAGIILITGPTGSGKTVTVATSMNILNKPEVNVVSIEDPVEIQVPGVNQVQVNNEAGLTFAKALRSFLRQDPNVISVGEIRDAETAQLAAQASLTGHLVISTLHTNSAAGVLPRLMDMGIEPYILASAVHVCSAQRLTRKVCKDCVYAYPIQDYEEVELRNVLTKIGSYNIAELAKFQKKFISNYTIMDPTGEQKIDYKDNTVYLFKGKGCQACHGTGYTGRLGIFEAYKVTEKIGSAIMHNATTDDIERFAVEDGMIKMIQDGFFKALEGLTTIEEVKRVISS